MVNVRASRVIVTYATPGKGRSDEGTPDRRHLCAVKQASARCHFHTCLTTRTFSVLQLLKYCTHVKNAKSVDECILFNLCFFVITLLKFCVKCTNIRN